MDLKNSKTEKNIYKAFESESKVRNKYKFYSEKAKEEGFEDIASKIEEISDNEEQHAKIWFKLLDELSDSTLKNLRTAAQGENDEWTSMYPQMEKEAREEGFNDIANLFAEVAKIEKEHENTFQQLIKALNDQKVFKKDNVVQWQCTKCGHIHSGTDAPIVCPVCSHPQSYFKEKSGN